MIAVRSIDPAHELIGHFGIIPHVQNRKKLALLKIPRANIESKRDKRTPLILRKWDADNLIDGVGIRDDVCRKSALTFLKS